VAKAKVRLEGEQTVSTAVERANASLKRMREETQKQLGPLKQIRDTMQAAFAATGIIQGVRLIADHIQKLTIAYREQEKAIHGVKLITQDTAAGAMARMDAAVAKLNAERGRSLATFFRPLIDWYTDTATKAAEAAKAHNDYIDALDRQAKGTATTADAAALVRGRISALQAQNQGATSLAAGMRQGMTPEQFQKLQENAQKMNAARDKEIYLLMQQAEALERGAKAQADAAQAAADYEAKVKPLYAKTLPGQIAAMKDEIAELEKLKKGHEDDARLLAALADAYTKLNDLQKKSGGSTPTAPASGHGLMVDRGAMMQAIRDAEAQHQATVDQFIAAMALAQVLPNEAEGFDKIAYAAARAAAETDKVTLSAADALSQAANFLNGIDAIFTQSQRNREITLENEYKTRKDRIEASISDEGERADAIAALDKDFAEKRAALQTREAKASKAQALMGASVNTAQAIISALASVQPTVPAGVAAAAIAGVVGAAQIALIAAQPIPKFSRGGSFVVPPGYPNDSFPMAVESGERVTVTPAAAVAGGGGPGGLPRMIVVRIGSREFDAFVEQEIADGRILLRGQGAKR
jgi:hypothetical protein